MEKRTADTVAWLLSAQEPAVQYLIRRDLLDEDAGRDRAAITAGLWVSALLAGQQDDGGFGGNPYRKWTGAHWRLVALAELAVPAGDPPVAAAAEHVLALDRQQFAVSTPDGRRAAAFARQHPRQRARRVYAARTRRRGAHPTTCRGHHLLAAARRRLGLRQPGRASVRFTSG